MALEKLALHYAVNFPGISTCCVGMASTEQVLQAVQISQTDKLTETEQRVQDRLLRRFYSQSLAFP